MKTNYITFDCHFDFPGVINYYQSHDSIRPKEVCLISSEELSKLVFKLYILRKSDFHKNTSLIWQEELISMIPKEDDFIAISKASNVSWSETMLKKFKDRWNYAYLFDNKSIPSHFFPLITDCYLNKSQKEYGSHIYRQENFIWTKVAIQKILSRAASNSHLRQLHNREFPFNLWSDDLLVEFADYIPWYAFEEKWIESFRKKTIINEYFLKVELERSIDNHYYNQLKERKQEFYSRKWNSKTIEVFIDKLELKLTSKTIALEYNLLKRLKDNLDWRVISGRLDLPINLSFYEEFKECLDWHQLSQCKVRGIDYHEFLVRFHNYLDWSILSKHLPIEIWTSNFIRRWKEKIDWNIISNRIGFNLPSIVICEIKETLNWEWNKSRDITINGTHKLVLFYQPYRDMWHNSVDFNEIDIWYNNTFWTRELIDEVRDYVKFHDLSCLYNVEWTQQLLAAYVDKWDWTHLSMNKGLPWTEELIAHFESYWDWELLSSATYLPWSSKLVLRYKERWRFKPKYGDNYSQLDKRSDVLSSNPTIYWDCNLLNAVRNNVCFFRIALHGKLDDHAIVEFANEFDKKCECGSVSYRWSDFTDSFEVIKNGWELLAENPNFVISDENLGFYENRDSEIHYITNGEPYAMRNGETLIPQIGISCHIGNLARHGYNATKKVKVIDILTKRYVKYPISLLDTLPTGGRQDPNSS